MDCKCHKAYDAGHDWWNCEVHGKVTKSDYEDEYDTTDAKPAAKKARPKAPAAKKPTPKPDPEPAPDGKKARPVNEDDTDDSDDLGAPPDKTGDEGGSSDTPTSDRPRGFGWG
jgi:hypothetical protein